MALHRIVRKVNSHSFRFFLVSSALTQTLGANVRANRCSSVVGSVDADKHRAEIVHNIAEDRQKASALETKFQAKVCSPSG